MLVLNYNDRVSSSAPTVAENGTIAGMRISILTLFPDYFTTVFSSSIIGKAIESGKASVNCIQIRDFAHDVQHTTDDRPFGGGPGMVMKVEPIVLALESVKSTLPADARVTVLLTSAQGQAYTQPLARTISTTSDEVIIICGHYEGVDERVAEAFIDYEVRIGDFVLSGGEPAAAAIADSLIRLVPGVLGNEASTQGESHEEPGILGFPQYTRPQVFRDLAVPEVLLSGNHKDITAWREAHRKDFLSKNSS